MFPWLPARLLVRDRFDSAAKAPQVKMPVLLVHGTRDEVIPVDMGQTLGRLFPHATVRLVEGATHNDVFYAPGVLQELVRFAREGASPVPEQEWEVSTRAQAVEGDSCDPDTTPPVVTCDAEAIEECGVYLLEPKNFQFEDACDESGPENTEAGNP